jgi:hypothetical protein
MVVMRWGVDDGSVSYEGWLCDWACSWTYGLWCMASIIINDNGVSERVFEGLCLSLNLVFMFLGMTKGASERW